MKSKLSDIPILKTLPTYVEAAIYNRIRIASKRLSYPLRIELTNLRGLDVIVDDEAWVCVDRSLKDLPILAWTDFDVRQRQSLTAGVPCQLRFFHSHADLISGSVLGLTYRRLEERLKQLRLIDQKPGEVLSLRRR